MCDERGERVAVPGTELDALRTFADAYAATMGEAREDVTLLVFGKPYRGDDEAALEATLGDLGVTTSYTLLAWRGKVRSRQAGMHMYACPLPQHPRRRRRWLSTLLFAQRAWCDRMSMRPVAHEA